MENILHTIFLKLPPFRLDISEAFVEARQFRFLISNTTRGKFLLQIISRFSRHIFFVFLIELCNVACLCSSEGSVTELLNTGVAQRKQRLCDVEDSRGTYIKTRSCSGLSGLYIFFHFQFVACRKVKSIWLRFQGIFIREAFSQSLYNPANILPSFCLLCFRSLVVKVIVFMIFFV